MCTSLKWYKWVGEVSTGSKGGEGERAGGEAGRYVEVRGERQVKDLERRRKVQRERREEDRKR